MTFIKNIALFTFIVLFFAFKAHAYSGINYNVKDTIDNDFGSFVFNDNLFEEEEVLNISLKLDLKAFIKEKDKEKYMPAYLIYTKNDSTESVLKVKIKSRGVSRKEMCYFPPYWLKLDLPDEIMAKDGNLIYNKAKVVSHCKESSHYQVYLFKEYLVYKIFNILTDNSFRVRLLKIKYIDSENNNTSEQFAFIIEPEELLADRLNSYPIERDDLLHVQMDSMLVTTMSLFQYMIGNTDYSITGRHNMKILKPKDHMKLYLTPVPYDFDFSGLVNAHYAKPSPKTGLKNVTERYFYGLCKSDETFNLVINQFQNKRNEIKNYILSFSYLNKREREKVWEYIEEFYQETENEHFIDRKIRRTCKQ